MGVASITRSGVFLLPAWGGSFGHAENHPRRARQRLRNCARRSSHALTALRPEIRIVELDIETGPQRDVDVTLFDTYGEVQEMRQRARELAADPANGAVIVFSFSDDAALAQTYLPAGARGFISKGLPANEIVEGIRAAAGGETVTLVRPSQHGKTSAERAGPAVTLVLRNGKANCWQSFPPE